jgi:hypothetical protein
MNEIRLARCGLFARYCYRRSGNYFADTYAD